MNKNYPFFMERIVLAKLSAHEKMVKAVGTAHKHSLSTSLCILLHRFASLVTPGVLVQIMVFIRGQHKKKSEP